MGKEIRIIYQPLQLSLGGTLLQQQNVGLGALLLDPKRYTPEGLKEAAQYASPESAIKPAAILAKMTAGERKQAIDFFFKNEAGKTFMEHAAVRVGTPEFTDEIKRAGQPLLDAIIQNPKPMFDLIDAQRQSAAHIDKKAAAGFSAPEEMIRRELEKSSSYYPEKSPEMAEHAEKLEQTARRALSRLPGYLRKSLEEDAATLSLMNIVYVQGHKKMAHAISNYDARSISINTAILQDTPKLDAVLKEEVLHYLDDKKAYTSRPEFKTAMVAFMADTPRIEKFETTLEKLCPGKVRLRTQDPEHHGHELLADYISLRDKLKEMAGRSGCATLFMKPGAERVESSVDKQMRGLVGDQVHELCRGFEAELAGPGTAKALPGRR